MLRCPSMKCEYLRVKSSNSGMIWVVCGDRMEVVGWDGLIHCDELGLI